MNIEEIREYCISKKAVTESTPFDEVTLVFKVAGKMFALIPMDETVLSISLKCDPENAVTLRERYPGVQPAYHMNKQHWNSVVVDGSIDKKEILQWIDDSYKLVSLGLTKKQRVLLEEG